MVDKVFLVKGERTGFIYAGIESCTRPGTYRFFDTPPPGFDWKLRALLRLATSYWGLSQVDNLTFHLANPAPPFTMIGGANNDAWISSPDPDTIFYFDGNEFYPDEDGNYFWYKVPAPLLRDVLLDFRDATQAIESQGSDQPSDEDTLGQMDWSHRDAGFHRRAIEVGAEMVIDDNDNLDGYGRVDGVASHLSPSFSDARTLAQIDIPDYADVPTWLRPDPNMWI